MAIMHVAELQSIVRPSERSKCIAMELNTGRQIKLNQDRHFSNFAMLMWCSLYQCSGCSFMLSLAGDAGSVSGQTLAALRAHAHAAILRMPCAMQGVSMHGVATLQRHLPIYQPMLLAPCNLLKLPQYTAVLWRRRKSSRAHPGATARLMSTMMSGRERFATAQAVSQYTQNLLPTANAHQCTAGKVCQRPCPHAAALR